MKVALVYPHTKGNWLGCHTPLSMLYVATSAKAAGHQIKVFDRDWGPYTITQLVSQVSQYNPDLIGFPSFSTALAELFTAFSTLRTQCPKATYVIGGHHASALPERVLEEFTGCNYVLRGEAEESFVQLCDVVEKGGSIESIPGLCYRNNGSIVKNELAPIVKDLDRYPIPDRDLLRPYFRKDVYWRVGYPGISEMIISSRGCPSSCRFCFKLTPGYRMRSVQNVVDEIMYLHSKGVKSIHIEDDLFTVNKKRAMEVLETIKREKCGIVFKLRARVDTIDEELLNVMKEAGVKAVVYGLESGSQKMLDLMNKRVTVEQNLRAVQMTKKVGIQCMGDILVGFPGETPETIEESIRFVLKAKPTGILLAILWPLPGTYVYEQAKKEGTLVGDWGVHNPVPWVRLPWAQDRDTLKKYWRKMGLKFYFHPIIFFTALSKTLSLFKSFTQFKHVMYHVAKGRFKREAHECR